MTMSNEKYNSRFPDWYWTNGLHDAKILSISYFERTPDWKSKMPIRNRLQIEIDGTGALFEQNIRTMRLFNCKIKEPEINPEELYNKMDFDDFCGSWWINDTLNVLSNNRYSLEINVETAKQKHKKLIVEFEQPEIIYKE